MTICGNDTLIDSYAKYYSLNEHLGPIHTYHAMPMPRPCRSFIHTCHAVPLPCSDSAVSIVKVRMVAGNIRIASPTV